MCTCNRCEGSGWISYLEQSGPNEYDRVFEPCLCNLSAEPDIEHSDKECIRDVTQAL
mgnify:CR=1 FL=1